MQRPTFFLSSTIYDFRDLRGALKFSLERQGCRVLASEYNDFTKPLDQHSYQACLSTIEQADYFILLIGSRVGGWYDEPNRVSITQQEYRTAYQLQTTGRLRLLSFVRNDVWRFREDAKSLRKHLKKMHKLDKETAAQTAAFPSKFANDAEFIVRFIDEVARNKETSAAVAGHGDLPTGNWLHAFESFSDIIDVIEPLIFNGLAVDDAAKRKALQMQLLLLLQNSLVRIRDTVGIPRQSVSKLVQSISLKTQDAVGTTMVAHDNWNSLATLTTFTASVEAKAEVFEPFLASPLLLQYEPIESSFRPTRAYELLARLIDQIRRFTTSKAHFDYAKFFAYGANRHEDSVTLPTILVADAVHMLLRWVEMMDVAKALAQMLEGQQVQIPKPMPRSPFVDQEEDQLAKEAVTLDQVKQYLNLRS